MHLVIYRQRRDQPIIASIPPAVTTVLALALAVLLILPVYLGLSTHRVRSEVEALASEGNLYSRSLASVSDSVSDLERRIRYAMEHPNTPEVLFEALEKAFGPDPRPSIHPTQSGEAAVQSGGDYYVLQLAAHRSREEAEAIAGQFRVLIGRNVETRQVNIPTGVWYRVEVTPFETEKAARSYAEMLFRRGVIKEYYIRHPGDTTVRQEEGPWEKP